MRNHCEYLRTALLLARRGLGHTRPNPPVGAVIVNHGKIIAKGWHRRCGEEHAEVMAIRLAQRSYPELLKGSTLYVTLEPCSTAGRVGACTDAIGASGIVQVYYACKDPNPRNRGKARRSLAKFGIGCKYVDVGFENFYAPFAKYVTTGLPYVTVKMAMSLDGRTCDDFGDSKWISNARSRQWVSGLRSTVDAVMVGAETVRRDNPSLLPHGYKNHDLIRVIISRSGKLPRKSQVFTDGAPNDTLVFPDAELAVRELGKLGVVHILCEGGMQLAVSLAEAGLVDEWYSVIAPCVIGPRHIADKIQFKNMDSKYEDGFYRAVNR